MVGPPEVEVAILEIRSGVEAIAQDNALHEDRNFGRRVDALDFLEFDVKDRIDSLIQTSGRNEDLAFLLEYAWKVKKSLENIDERLFHRLRGGIASRDYSGAALKQMLVEYTDAAQCEGIGEEGYDRLDAFTNGLLLIGRAPKETRVLEPEMVSYQPTPARFVLKLVESGGFRLDDVFYDIGSGLGQVSILVHLLGGVQAIGVEIEPAYCDFAEHCVQTMNLAGVTFINVDAREANYSNGTVFFLYTPFVGRILDQVLGKLRIEAAKREIRLFSLGSCTLELERQGWLERVDRTASSANGLAEFRSTAYTRQAARSALRI